MPYDQICLSCHTAPSGQYSEIAAPFAKIHSSETTRDKNSELSWRCCNCHDPHYKKQKNYKNTDASSTHYLATVTIADCDYNDGDDTSTVTYLSITYKTG